MTQEAFMNARVKHNIFWNAANYPMIRFNCLSNNKYIVHSLKYLYKIVYMSDYNGLFLLDKTLCVCIEGSEFVLSAFISSKLEHPLKKIWCLNLMLDKFPLE
jgi:uncharacterized protein (DUF2132 family)